MVVSVFYKKLECKADKLKHKKLVFIKPRIQNKRKFQHVNKSVRISSNKGLSRDWLIRLVKNEKGRGGKGGLKERGSLTFSPWIAGGGVF